MIEPCCCDRQAPAAIKAAGGNATLFTNGDVTVQKWFSALSSLAGPNHQMTLLVRQPDVQLLRWLRTWMQRGWTTQLHLTTLSSSTASEASASERSVQSTGVLASDVPTLVAAELDGLTDRVTVAQDTSMPTEMVIFQGERGVVVIAGPMLTAPQPGLTVYACHYDKDGQPIADLLAAVTARHRQHRVALATAPAAPAVSDSTADEAPADVQSTGVLASDSPTPKKKTKKK